MERITSEQYAKSVLSLLKLARSGGGSATGAAAQILLSTYNGSHWHVDLTDLCHFDPEHYQDALNVIRGRVELYKEPHSVIADGNSHFRALWDDWYLFHVGNRNLRICPECEDSGKEWDSEWTHVIGPCRRCDGARRVNQPRFEHSRNIKNKFEKPE